MSGHTYTHTHTHTYTHDNYYNPRCVHAHRGLINIIESVDSISRDERGYPLTQYITNGGISRAGYTITLSCSTADFQ